jgi:hypothetical protein
MEWSSVDHTSALSSVVRIKQVCTWCCNTDSLCLFAAAPAYVQKRKNEPIFCFILEAHSCVLCASSLRNSAGEHHL